MLLPALALAFAAETAAVTPLVPKSTEVTKLDNGLTVVTVPFNSPGIVAYYTLVEAGSRDEVEAGKSGYAHLFEHLMFRGTDKISSEDYEKKLQLLGADDNAFTTDDFTMYTTTLPKDGLGDLIAVNADRFEHLHYQADKYKDETGAVLGERNKVFSNPEAQMREDLAALAFKTHTYGHTTIGNKRDVEDMPNQYDYSIKFWKRFYTPDDCVILVVGDFDKAKTLDQIKSAYGSWQGKRAKTEVKAEPEQKAPRARAIPWHGPTEPRLNIGYRVPAANASLADTAALATLVAATFGEPSDLYQRLVVKEQKVLDLGADPDDVVHADPGLLVVDAKLAPQTSFDEVIGAVQGAIDSAARGELAPAKIEAARDHIRNGLILGTQTPGQLAVTIGWLTRVTNGDVYALDKWNEALGNVKPEDVARVAKLLTPAHRDVITLTQGAEPAKAQAAKKGADAKKDANAKKGGK
jgi:zinc protease